MSTKQGVLYIVATPIGNLEDISLRAQRILQDVDLIVSEDTRHSKKLLSHFCITTSQRSFHDFNQRELTPQLLEQITAGANLALISDAGTPLINDPGYLLVKSAHEKGVKVVPIPGPCAIITALSAAGLPTDHFTFEGYVPEKKVARMTFFQSLISETRTIVLYETPHRIQASLHDAAKVFGNDRMAVVARELTKKYETIQPGKLGELVSWLQKSEDNKRGEFVVLIKGADVDSGRTDYESIRVLELLLSKLKVKDAAFLAAQITGKKKNEMYKLALGMVKQ